MAIEFFYPTLQVLLELWGGGQKAAGLLADCK